MRTLIAAALTMAFGTVNAQEDRVPVVVSSSVSEPRSRQFAFELTEAIKGSKSLSIADSDDAIDRIHIVAVDTSRGVAYSYVKTWKNGDFEIYENHLVGVCPADEVPQCARGLLSTIASDTDSTRRLVIRPARLIKEAEAGRK